MGCQRRVHGGHNTVDTGHWVIQPEALPEFTFAET